MQWTIALDRWTDHMTAAAYSPTTIELRRYQIGRLARDHAAASPWHLAAGDLVSWIAGQTWAASTRRSYRAALRTFYGWAEQSGHVDRSPAALLPRVRAQRGRARPVAEDVLAAAMAAADDRVRLIIALAAFAGLRRGEIVRLRWADVSDTAITVHGKGDKVRIVPMHRVLRPLLAAERRRREAGTSGTGWRYTVDLDVYLFPGMNGGPMTPGALGRIVARARRAMWTLHMLRHRFASRARAMGADLLAIQELLGHASLDHTRIYTETPDGALEAAVNAI